MFDVNGRLFIETAIALFFVHAAVCIDKFKEKKFFNFFA